MMTNLRIEYLSGAEGIPERRTIPVPDIATALVVAQLNSPDGMVELWEGDRQLAVLERQRGDLSPLWRVN
jgi:hypothetical protein